MSNETTIDDLAHEAWSAAQLAPGDGIEDAVRRIAGLIAAALDDQAQQIEALTAERDEARRMFYAACQASAAFAVALGMDETENDPSDIGDAIDELTAERDELRRRLDDAKPATPAPGEWIEWRGGECPLADGVGFQFRFRDDSQDQTSVYRDATTWTWTHRGYSGDIIAYRILP